MGKAGVSINDGLRPLYGRFGWAYDLVVPNPAGGNAEHIAQQMSSLGVPSDSLVVDAGCGTGRYSQELAALSFRVIGLDTSEALVEQARARTDAATFICADLLTWRADKPVHGVLCRGVLNDLTDDDQRKAACVAFSSWLSPEGVLVADVRDWEATAARYAKEPRHGHSASEPGRELQFSSVTTLASDLHLMHVHERYIGMVEDVHVDESYDFTMRCWVVDELRSYLADAGFSHLELTPGGEAGIASDRLLVVARR